MSMLSRLRHEEPGRPIVSRQAIQERLLATDPDYEAVRRVQHDAMQALTAKSIADGLAMRHEREFWRQHGHEHA